MQFVIVVWQMYVYGDLLKIGNLLHEFCHDKFGPPFLFPPVHNIWTPRSKYFKSIWTPLKHNDPLYTA